MARYGRKARRPEPDPGVVTIRDDRPVEDVRGGNHQPLRRNRADALLQDYLLNFYKFTYNPESAVGEKAYEAARVVAFILDELQFEDPSPMHLWERIISGETIPR